jgi:hypothetical protein
MAGERDRRITLAKRNFPAFRKFLTNQHISISRRLIIYKNVVLNTLLEKMHFANLLPFDIQALKSAQVMFGRKLLGVGSLSIHQSDMIRTHDANTILFLLELPTIVSVLRVRRLRWLRRNAVRGNHERQPQQVLAAWFGTFPWETCSYVPKL